MVNKKLTLLKTIGYKTLGTLVYMLLFGMEFGLYITLVSLVLYYVYEIVFNKIFKIRQDHEGSVVLLTGLPCSGKTTIGNEMKVQLEKAGKRVVVLDGDLLRTGICSDLGFSDKDRAENLRRVGHLAKTLKDSGVIAICCLVSPFERDREMLSDICGDNFYEIYIDTPATVCEMRDVKGMWKLAREGKIKGFTGYDAPYEEPRNPDLVIKTTEKEDNAKQIIRIL